MRFDETMGEKIPILPVHDSFICINRHQERLKEMMEKAYEKFTAGLKPKMKMKDMLEGGGIVTISPKELFAEYDQYSWWKRSSEWHRSRWDKKVKENVKEEAEEKAKKAQEEQEQQEQKEKPEQ